MASAASSADQVNLVFLREANVGASELSRFFFTITQEGTVQPPEDRPRVRRLVVDALHGLGIDPDRTYFIEVLREHNQDFRDLLTDLNRFVTQNKGSLVVSWIQRAQKVITGVHDRHQSRLTVLQSGEQARLKRLKLLRAEAKEVAKLRDDVRTFTGWGEPHLRNRIALARAAAASDIDSDITGLTDRNAFDTVEEDLESSLDDLNQWARDSVDGGCSAAANGLQAEVGARLPGRTISRPVIPPGDEFFPATEILQAVRAARWRTGWQRFKDIFRSDSVDWNADIETNRERIAREWRISRRAGERRLSTVVNTITAQLSAEIDRLADSIAQEIQHVEQPPSPHDNQVATVGRDRSIDLANAPTRRIGQVRRRRQTLTSVSETHDETVSLISDAVTKITERAIDPTLAPFKTAMRGAIDRLEEQADELKKQAGELKKSVVQAQRNREELAAKLTDVTTHQEQLSEQIRQLRGLVENQNARSEGVVRWLVVVLALVMIAGMVTVLLFTTW